MMNVGCDIGKSNLDIFLGGKHRKFENNSEGISKFVSVCRENIDIRVIIEPTGGYERHLLRELFCNKIRVSVVNPYYVRNFAKSKQDLAKTDKIDAKVLAEYGEKMDPKIHERKEEYHFEHEDLTSRRDSLVETIKEEKLRLEKDPPEIISESIGKHLDFLKVELKTVDSTHKFAIRLIESGNAREYEIIAENQTDAIGRCGRKWISSAGNLFVSFLKKFPQNIRVLSKPTISEDFLGGTCPVETACRTAAYSNVREDSSTDASPARTSTTKIPEGLAPHRGRLQENSMDLGQLSLTVACAVRESISSYIPDDKDLHLHWPNDIYYKNLKVSGILMAVIDCWLVISIGVNVNSAPRECSAISITGILESLGAEPPVIAPKEIAKRINANICKWFGYLTNKGFFHIKNYWLQYLNDINSKITIKNGDRSLSGVFVGLDDSGRLILEKDSRNLFVSSGDIFINTESIVVHYE